MEILRKSESRQFERCVRCGKETEYTADAPVTIRYYFVDGAGQLCEECYEKIDSRKEAGYEDKNIHTI